MSYILKEIENILKSNGIEKIDENSSISSLTYITLICELEKKFEIEFPDEVLVTNVFSDVEYLERIITHLIDNKTQIEGSKISNERQEKI